MVNLLVMAIMAKDLLKQLQEMKCVDFRFTDLLGLVHHITYKTEALTGVDLAKGIGFDAVGQSDTLLRPDLNTLFIDPFYVEPTAVLLCEAFDPTTDQPYERDPRVIAQRAEGYFKQLAVADTAYFGPELEFFIFDDVRFSNAPGASYFFLDAEEKASNSGRKYETGNLGHRASSKQNYMSIPPVDTLHDLRTEMMSVLQQVGINPTLHYHAAAESQSRMGLKHSTLVQTADNVQKFKYIVHNVARSYNKSATFMPKPIYGSNGSGMYIHQSLWAKGKSLFYNDDTNLSELCLYYIGGIIKHAKALNAFTNPTTNSYKRLPDDKAQALLTYSASNPTAIRIPYTNSAQSKGIEVCFPDPTANPYLAFAALLMAGLDGIKNKIHPGSALNEGQQQDIPRVARSLNEALDALEQDCDFLKAGNVFSADMINSYINLKRQEVKTVESMPHPAEFGLYYSS